MEPPARPHTHPRGPSRSSGRAGVNSMWMPPLEPVDGPPPMATPARPTRRPGPSWSARAKTWRPPAGPPRRSPPTPRRPDPPSPPNRSPPARARLASCAISCSPTASRPDSPDNRSGIGRLLGPRISHRCRFHDQELHRFLQSPKNCSTPGNGSPKKNTQPSLARETSKPPRRDPA